MERRIILKVWDMCMGRGWGEVGVCGGREDGARMGGCEVGVWVAL